MHALMTAWFSHVRDWSYLGVFVLMAIESTVFPLPSEVVVPPAAYWAARGELHFWGVVLAATLGSWAGSAVWSTVLAYFGARVLGDQVDLLVDPLGLEHVLRRKLVWFVAAAALLLALYIVVDIVSRRLKREAAAETGSP